MNILSRFPLVAFNTTVTAILAYGVSQRRVDLLLASALLAVVSWYLTEGPRRITLPSWAATLLVVCVLGWSLLEWPARSDPAELASLVGRFVLWTTVIKLFERKGTREWRQLMALSLVLLLAGCLVSTDLLFALLLVIYTVLGVTATMLYRLRRGQERAAEARRSLTGGALPQSSAITGRQASRHLRRLVVAATVAGAVLSAILFVLFPRDLMRRFEGAGGITRLSGFSGEVDLMAGGLIEPSRREVMTVEWLDVRGKPEPAVDVLRLRGAVFDRYNPTDGRWSYVHSRRRQRPVTLAIPGGFTPLGRPAVDTRIQTWTQVVEMRGLATDILFSAWAPVAVASDEPRAILLDTDTLELRDGAADRGGRLWRYEVRVQPFPNDAALQALCGPAEPVERPSFPVPEVVREARLVVEAAGERAPTEAEMEREPALRWQWARRAARLLSSHLQSSSFTYTLDLSGVVRRRGEDPIEVFLLRRRSGHCELFASALCGMLQGLGVEARLVTGFVAAEYDAALGRYIVREANAHAWVEVRTGEWAWTTFDPTPPDTLAAIATANRTWSDSLRWLYDGLDFLWRSRVATFDSSSQTTLLRGAGERLGRTLQDLTTTVSDWAATVGRRAQWAAIGPVWLGSIVMTLAGAVAITVLVMRRERRLRRRLGLMGLTRAARRALRAQATSYLEALEALERHGLGKPEHRPPLAHAEVLAEGAPEAAEAFAHLTRGYYEVRYGMRQPAPSAQADAERSLRTLEAALRRAPQPGSADESSHAVRGAAP